ESYPAFLAISDEYFNPNTWKLDDIVTPARSRLWSTSSSMSHSLSTTTETTCTSGERQQGQ
ncbi:MAG: hypothetical protein ACKPKO_50740, partial [Candidatus Fonsibacter sp.]